jgi:nucleoside-diphosphate-sugar epimerase
VAARFLCRQLSSSLGVSFIYTVLASLYGVGREDKNVVYYTLDCLLKGQRPSLTKLEQRWDFLHVQDAVAALFAIGEKGHDGGFYPIGNGDNLPLAD